ncbi:MAG: prepilin peptidase [Candidatus Buchananbacteria bacterium]|nr:prepilin peptidase [Candidatus Buchananbacteria bacterium]
MFESILFIFGLIIGSFLNVVIARLGKKKSFWSGRSECPKCKYQINWYDNIPVISFIILRGRCRNCHQSISWQYPMVELATALMFVWIYTVFGLGAKFFIYSVFSSFLMVLFVYDLKHYLILDRVSVPAMIVAFLGNIYLGAGLADLLLGSAIGAGFFAAQYFISGGRWVGDGDIRLGAVMGLMLGWKFVLVALFIAYLTGATVGVFLMMLKKKKMSSEVPFGPFLTLATFITMLYGRELINWYFNLFYR